MVGVGGGGADILAAKPAFKREVGVIKGLASGLC